MELNISKLIKPLISILLLIILPLLAILFGVIFEVLIAWYYIICITWFGMGIIFYGAIN
jgi:hypothetical protein